MFLPLVSAIVSFVCKHAFVALSTANTTQYLNTNSVTLYILVKYLYVNWQNEL
jgi:hypothetical protein